jgi:hypothetical protein
VRVRANAAEIRKPDDSAGRKASESGYISEEEKRPEGQLKEVKRPEVQFQEVERPEGQLQEVKQPEGQLQEVKRPEGKKPENKPPEEKRSVKKFPEDELLDDKKPEDRQSDDKRPEDKILDDKRPEDKQPEDKILDDKGPEDNRPEDKQPEDKRNEEVKRTGEKISEDKLTELPKEAIENIVQNLSISPSTKAEASRQTVGITQSVQDGINSLACLDIPGSQLDSTKIPRSSLGSRKGEEEEDCYLIIESPDMFKDDIAPSEKDPIDQRLESGCLTIEGASDVTVGDTDAVGSSTGDVSGKSDVTDGTGDVITGATDVITSEPGEAQVARTKSLLMSLLGGGAGTTTASPPTRHGGTQPARHGGPRESQLPDDPACPSQFLLEGREGEGETLLELAQSLLVRQWKLVATTKIHPSQVVPEYSVPMLAVGG